MIKVLSQDKTMLAETSMVATYQTEHVYAKDGKYKEMIATYKSPERANEVIAEMLHHIDGSVGKTFEMPDK